MEERKQPETNPADANLHNRRYLDELLVEMRIIDAYLPDLTLHLFNETFSSPIMMPAFPHLKNALPSGRTPIQEYSAAAKEMNLVNFVGMEPDEYCASIAAEGAKTVRIIKPFEDKDIIFSQIAFAKGHQASGSALISIMSSAKTENMMRWMTFRPARSQRMI